MKGRSNSAEEIGNNLHCRVEFDRAAVFDGFGVWIVIVNVDAVRPGTSDGGLKIAVAPVGSPRALKTTGVVRGAFCAWMVKP